MIDIEADDLLELPASEEPIDENVTKQQSHPPEVPSSAELHCMAASIVNAIPPHAFETQGNIFFYIKINTLKMYLALLSLQSPRSLDKCLC